MVRNSNISDFSFFVLFEVGKSITFLAISFFGFKTHKELTKYSKFLKLTAPKRFHQLSKCMRISLSISTASIIMAIATILWVFYIFNPDVYSPIIVVTKIVVDVLMLFIFNEIINYFNEMVKKGLRKREECFKKEQMNENDNIQLA